MVLIEVDDINIGCIPEYLGELQKAMQKRFVFGKWEFDEADFAGRHIKVTKDKVILDQYKYIIEKILPVKVSKGRLGNKASPLEPEEFEQYRSLLYKINLGGSSNQT